MPKTLALALATMAFMPLAAAEKTVTSPNNQLVVKKKDGRGKRD